MSLDISLENELAQRIVARLQTITVANGYLTDAGARVYRGKRKINDDDIPCIAVFEGEDSVFEQKEQQVTTGLPYAVQGFIECDPDNPSIAAQQLVRDIKQALFAEHLAGYPHWGRLASGAPMAARTVYVGRDIAPREDGANVISATVQIRIDITALLAE